MQHQPQATCPAGLKRLLASAPILNLTGLTAATSLTYPNVSLLALKLCPCKVSFSIKSSSLDARSIQLDKPGAKAPVVLALPVVAQKSGAADGAVDTDIRQLSLI